MLQESQVLPCAPSISLYLFVSKPASTLTLSSEELCFLLFKIRHYFVLDFFHVILCKLTILQGQAPIRTNLQASIQNENAGTLVQKGKTGQWREATFAVSGPV